MPFYSKFDVDSDLQKDHNLKLNHSKIIDRYMLQIAGWSYNSGKGKMVNRVNHGVGHNPIISLFMVDFQKMILCHDSI